MVVGEKVKNIKKADFFFALLHSKAPLSWRLVDVNYIKASTKEAPSSSLEQIIIGSSSQSSPKSFCSNEPETAIEGAVASSGDAAAGDTASVVVSLGAEATDGAVAAAAANSGVGGNLVTASAARFSADAPSSSSSAPASRLRPSLCTIDVGAGRAVADASCVAAAS